MDRRRVRPAAALLLALVTSVLAACSEESTGTNPVIETAAGTLRGTVHDGIRSFRGIPYAGPPVGDLRWAAPRPPEPWHGERDATAYRSACVQLTTSIGAVPRLLEDSSEDCLFLNVNRPDDDADDLPVMVYLHGGGFVAGRGSDA
ncbi:carboxylesterase family protein, partial [Nocardioides sp.]|uniref:carboxylesterase family protein n=1 Tax=Nocardioides sp. TaxID=35761 RepID=UPI00273372D3